MTISAHAEQFAGKTVEDYSPETGITDPTNKIYRISTHYDAEEGIVDCFNTFLEDPRVGEISGIVIGCWITDVDESSEEIVEALAAAREQLPNLKAIFLGDMTYEEAEISWIVQSDVSPLLTAYPQLEYLQVRGNQGLSLGALQHDRLKSLVVETGGLSVDVVREVCNAQLPELEHLELWLGIEDYGGDTTVDDLQPILTDQLFPKLRYLGLRDSEIADEIAIALADASVLEQIKVLDLSLGTLRDVGAEALLNNPAIAQLEKLDIHHHYVSDELVTRLEELGIELDASDRQEEEEYGDESYFYVAVSE